MNLIVKPVFQRRIRQLTIIAAAALLPFSAGAQDAGSSKGNDNVLAAIKFPPVRAFTDSLMGVARQVNPGQETEMLPLLFLGAFGYPNFAGVSETEPVTVFLFDSTDSEEMPFVILSKMSDSAALRNALTAQADPGNPMAAMLAPGFSVEDRDGWTLFSSSPENFKLVKNVSELAAMGKSVDDFDVTFRFFIGPEKMSTWVNTLKEEVTDEHLMSGGSEKDEDLGFKLRYIDFLATIGENLDYYDFGIDINNQAISLGTVLQALEGTPEYTMLSAKAGGSSTVGEFVSASAPITYVSNIDMKAVAEYYSVLNHRALKLATDEGKALLKRAAQTNAIYFSKAGNSTAGSLDFDNDAAISSSVASGNLSNDELVKISKSYYDDILPAVLKHLAEMQFSDEAAAEFVLKENVGEVAGDPINEMISKIKVDTGLSLHEDENDAQPEYETEESYFAVVDGNVVTANNIDALKALAKVVAGGKAVENNAASRIELASGEAMGYQIDFKPLIDMMIESNSMQSQSAKQVYKDLSSADLEPAAGGVTLGNGRAKATLSAPLSSIVKIMEAQKRIEQAELEAQTFGPDAE
ncbi:MAG: hypothetical protein AAFX93_18840 [Verrucomicrobiota bacterium]